MWKGRPGLTSDFGDVAKQLEEYGSEVLFVLQEVTKDVGETAAKRLKSTSPRSSGRSSFKGGHYGDKWTTQSDRNGKLDTVTVVYNKKPTYRLTHLLENGYVARNGRRVGGQVHIAPVEKWVKNEVVEELARRLST